MEIGSEIKALREKAGLSQGELAKKSGLSRTSIHKYETGGATPRMAQLEKVAAALGTTSDHFWSIDKAAPPETSSCSVGIASHAACIGCIHLKRFRKSALLCEAHNKLIIPEFPPTRCDDREETVMEPIRRSQILQSAIDTYGIELQMDMMVEECSELIQAICKYKRGRDDAAANICEEIADVQIVLDQMKLVFEMDTITQNEEQKLNRLRERLNRHIEKERSS